MEQQTKILDICNGIPHPIRVLRYFRQKNKRTEDTKVHKHKNFTHSFEWVIFYYSITAKKKCDFVLQN